jgi:hypothetical protein
MKKKFQLILIVFIVFLLTACQKAIKIAPDICSQEAVQNYNQVLLPILSAWDDTNEVANSTGRGNLSQVILKLQETKRDLDFSNPPSCLSESQKIIVNGMEKTISGYLGFIAEADNGVIANNFSDGTKLISDGIDGITKIMNCAPNCDK